MKLLALETATDRCSVALWRDGDVIERRQDVGTGHSRVLLPMLESLLAEEGETLAGLDAVAFGRGPGSFTGLRIAAGVAQGLAWAAGLPVVPVSSLAALAQADPSARVIAALDARMGQVYAGAFERGRDGTPEPVGEEVVCDPPDFPFPPGAGWTGAGSGWDRYGEVLAEAAGGGVDGWEPGRLPGAAAVARLGAVSLLRDGGVGARDGVPRYLRDRVTRVPARPRDG